MTFPNKIKAVIFDLDGLLIDSEQLWTDARNIVLKPFNVLITADIKKKVIGRDYETGLKYVIDYFKIPITVDQFAEKEAKVLDEIYKKKLTFMPGAEELIGEINRNEIKMAVTTGSNRKRLDLVKNILGLDGFVAEVTGDEIEKGKPAPDMFIKTCEKLMIKANSCVVVEDSPFGIMAARAAQMKSVAVYDSRFTTEEDFQGKSKPDLIVDSLDKLNISELEGLFK